jgi:hypothetical protein
MFNDNGIFRPDNPNKCSEKLQESLLKQVVLAFFQGHGVPQLCTQGERRLYWFT